MNIVDETRKGIITELRRVNPGEFFIPDTSDCLHLLISHDTAEVATTFNCVECNKMEYQSTITVQKVDVKLTILDYM